MDTIGWFIATLHQMIGHEKTSVVLGVPVGDMTACILCEYERKPTAALRERVILALSGNS